MNIDIRMDQGQALSQQLNLAPQLLNWLRLLQCPTTELSALVARELDSNPALETDDAPGDLGDTQTAAAEEKAPSPSVENDGRDDDLASRIEFLSEIETEWRYDHQQGNPLGGPSREEQREKHQYMMDSILAANSLQEHLLKQCHTLKLNDEDQLLAQFIVGSLDDRGYLETPVAELASTTGRTEAAVERVLAHVQSLDPAGIGARTLSECLLLQMDQRAEEGYLPALLVRDHLEAIAERRFEEAATRLGVTLEEVLDAVDLITTLDPSPGAAFISRPVEYVSPDVTVRRQDGELVMELNEEHLPHLRLSATCRQLVRKKHLTAEDRSYIRGKLRNASFLIQGIGQRQETLTKVTREILRVQRAYLLRDEGELRPLTMAKVASVIGVHETTVSRALANKYMETPRGIFEMKHFFRAGYLCSDGTALTPEAVKDKIKALIDQEPPTRPLTDLDIVEELQAQGLELARRTIAKYRDEMGIAASKQRKRDAQRTVPVMRISESVLARTRAPAAMGRPTVLTPARASA